MRVAIDLTSLADNFSGIERYAANMARSILKQDVHDEFVLLFKDSVSPWFKDFTKRLNIELRVMPRGQSGKAVFSQILLPHELNRLKPDIALFMAFPCPVAYYGTAISTVHDLTCFDCPDTMAAKSRLLWRVLDNQVVEGDQRVITISKFSRTRICKHYGKNSDQIVVAYCGIDRNLFNKEVGAGCETEVKQRYSLPERFVLSLSTIEPRKRLDLLVDAWAELWDEGCIDYDLVLAGRKGWKVDELLIDVSDNARNHICFTGFVKDADLPVLYRMANMFIFPSRYEGFGLPPVEAHNSGAHVLCSDILCHREICGNKVAYFKSGDKDDLKRALTDPNLFNEVSKEPLKYSWDTEAQKIMRTLGLSISCEMTHA
jgi:glycosyltransferase involved in cell wall biosynthesis